MNNRFIEVSDVLGLDNNRLWFYIPGYNGYEVSLDGYLRSMKHWKQYPTGILLRPLSRYDKVITDKNGNPIFEISNNNNRRVRVIIPDLIKLALENVHNYSGYPRKTYISDKASRNIRAFIVDNNHYMPQFTIKKDITENRICPIFNLLERGLYYGR